LNPSVTSLSILGSRDRSVMNKIFTVNEGRFFCINIELLEMPENIYRGGEVYSVGGCQL